jgi:light-regulated signal transduction histidine kinase (bacteriophytochrome)
MKNNNSNIKQPFNLTNCDYEKIHIPGAIQPHGVLLVINCSDWRISQVSKNTEIMIGLAPEKLLGQPLTNILDNQQISVIASCLPDDFQEINPLKLTILTDQTNNLFNGIVHRLNDDYIILELEKDSENNHINFTQFYHTSKNILNQIQRASKLIDLCQLMVQEVRKLTGFDRVMIYRFDETGSGCVIAEDCLDSLNPYLGLHYPDYDIPRQAKYLYTLNLLRMIPQVDYQPVPIVGEIGIKYKPLDLSFSVLRSVSPMHIKYLKNMGVAASFSISLLSQGKLWGLIACHHQTPCFIPYEIRNICEFLGQVMSLEIVSKETNELLAEKMSLQLVENQLINNLGQADNITSALVKDPDNLLALVNATGAAVYTEGNLITVGKVPNQEFLSNLILWLNDKFEQSLFVTNILPKVYPPAIACKDIASGLLALSITKVEKNYVLWFRPEVLQYVNWAGNPEASKHLAEDGTITFFPRQSFELWQEIVHCQSPPWMPWEIEGVMELRSAVVGIVLRKMNELTAINLELEHTNQELDAFAYIASHDLKEPLRGIHNYSNFLLEDYSHILDIDGVDKLNTLIKLTKRMEDLINALLHFSRLGRQELNIEILDLNLSLQSITEMFTISKRAENIDIRIPQPLPAVMGDRILIEEVLTNLISNSLKYNDKPNKWVEIGFLDEASSFSHNDSHNDSQNDSDFVTFYVQDNGIGIQEKHRDTIFSIFKRLHGVGKYGGGTGVGLTIVKKILERHQSKIWLRSVYGQGSTFYFTLPTNKSY